MTLPMGMHVPSRRDEVRLPLSGAVLSPGDIQQPDSKRQCPEVLRYIALDAVYTRVSRRASFLTVRQAGYELGLFSGLYEAVDTL